MNYAIDFEQLFVRIFGNFWYQSIRQTQENVHLLGTKFKNNFETILHDPLVMRACLTGIITENVCLMWNKNCILVIWKVIEVVKTSSTDELCNIVLRI